MLPGEATAIGSNGDNVAVNSCLLPQSSSMADSTSQKDVFDAGDNAGMSSDTDNSDTESVIKDPLASLAAECMSQWSSLKVKKKNILFKLQESYFHHKLGIIIFSCFSSRHMGQIK